MNSQITITHNDISTEKTLYNTDFYKWALHNANLIRQGRFAEIDVENVAEELESMGRSEKKELFNRLSVLIMHLLKLQYQQKRRSNSWIKTIYTQRVDIKILLEENPSLKYELELIIAKAYERAGLLFTKETGISKYTLPAICPYTYEQLSDDEFWPKEFSKG
ncbi:MAG: DUF29 domain-containing protein [Candidatus Magnetoovum sp. WYHC-5]|nr:DUF29 domain-containing protein [Candidatus Magnetoovum sp. WYHC-5]